MFEVVGVLDLVVRWLMVMMFVVVRCLVVLCSVGCLWFSSLRLFARCV